MIEHKVYTGEVEYPYTLHRSKLPVLPMPLTTDDDQVVAYSFIPETRIPPEHVRFVRRHLKRLCREAGLGPVRLRWYGPAVGTPDFWLRITGPDILVGGMSGRAGIAILAGLRGDALINAIAHEVQHLTQTADMTLRERETDAEHAGHAYERRVV